MEQENMSQLLRALKDVNKAFRKCKNVQSKFLQCYHLCSTFQTGLTYLLSASDVDIQVETLPDKNTQVRTVATIIQTEDNENIKTENLRSKRLKLPERITILIKERNRSHRKWQRSRNEEYLNRMKTLNNEIKTQVRIFDAQNQIS